MGSNASTGGGGGGVGPAGLVTKTGKTGTEKDAKKVSSRNEFRKFISEGGVTGRIIKGVVEGTKEQFAKSKMRRELDYESAAYGTKPSSYYQPPGGDGGNNGGAMGTSGQIVQAPTVTAPTTSEVSQAAPEVTAEQARATANELIAKKRRGRGRSMTILTSAQGIEDDKSLTLGKKILLG